VTRAGVWISTFQWQVGGYLTLPFFDAPSDEACMQRNTTLAGARVPHGTQRFGRYSASSMYLRDQRLSDRQLDPRESRQRLLLELVL